MACVVALTVGACSSGKSEKVLPNATAQWTSHVGAPSSSDVIATDKYVFVETRNASSSRDGFQVLDAATGERKWDLPPADDDRLIWVGDTAVVVTEHGDDGKQTTVYSSSTGRRMYTTGPEDINTTWPVVTNDTLVQGNESAAASHSGAEAIGIDLATGKKRWSTDLPGKPGSFMDLSVAAPKSDGELQGGTEKHTLQQASTTPLVFAGTGQDPEVMDSTVSLDTATGNTKWTWKKPLNGKTSGHDVGTLSNGDFWYVRGSCPDTSIDVIDAKDGKVTTTPAERTFFDSEGSSTCEGGADDGVFPVEKTLAMAQNDKHRPEVIDLTTGKPMWTAKESGTPLVLHRKVAIYSAAGEKRRSDTSAVDVATGKRLWKEHGDDTLNRPGWVESACDDLVFSSDQTYTYAFDLRTGRGRWRTAGNLEAIDADFYFVINKKGLTAIPR